MHELHNVVATDGTGVSPGLVLEHLFELGVRLADSMDQGLAEEGLTRARAEVIWRLARSGSTTQHALSLELHVTPRNVTGLIDALEAGGFVARTPHPTDRRATLVRLTDKGTAAARAMGEGYARLASSLFDGLSKGEMEGFAGTLSRVLGRLRQG